MNSSASVVVKSVENQSQTAQSQLLSALVAETEAESFLEDDEKRWEVIDVDL